MKKQIYPVIVIILLLTACNQPSKVAATNAGNEAIITMPVDSEMMKVSALSPAELIDDSVFTNGSVPSSWKVARVKDVKGLKLFIKQLQQWVISNDKEMLAAAVQYPLDDVIKTKENLIVNYNTVFSKPVKLSLATTNFNQLFRNERGVMLDGGKIWIAQKGDNFKIIVINYDDQK